MWKKEKIIDTIYIIDVDDNFKPISKGVLKRHITKNPNVNQLWFYYIRKNNIQALQEMIDEKVAFIDIEDSDDGETILHRAIQLRNMKLVNFSIKNNANLYHKSYVEKEIPFYEASQPYVGVKIFKEIWKLLPKNKLFDIFNEINCEEISLIQKLISNDKNLSKLNWIEKYFNNEWLTFKEDKEKYQKLINYAESKDAYKNVFFLRGLQTIKNNLKKNLIKNKSNKIRVNKI